MLAVARRATVLCVLALLASCGSGPSHPSCTSDANCTDGRVCKATECVGPDQCPSTQASCVNDNACGPGFSCQGGCCAQLPAGACKNNADCTTAATPHCDSGTCRACEANSECSAGTICTPTGACL